MRWRCLAAVLVLAPSAAAADAVHMEYDFGLAPGEMEIALLSYYTPAAGTQVLGVRQPFPSGYRSDELETFANVRLALFERWVTVLNVPMTVSRFETRRQITWAWGPGDIEWSHQVRVLGDSVYESLMLGAGIKFPSGSVDLETGTGTLEASAAVLVHQFFDPFFDTHLQLEYRGVVLGRQAGLQADVFLHNAGVSAQVFDDWTFMLEGLGTLAAGVGAPLSYRLELAPSVMYMVVDEYLWVAASALVPVVQIGPFDEVYSVSVNLSLYIDLAVF